MQIQTTTGYYFHKQIQQKLRYLLWDFPGGPVVKMLCFCGRAGVGLTLSQEADPASQVALGVKYSPVNAGHVRDLGSVPGSGRSPGGGHGNPLQ